MEHFLPGTIDPLPSSSWLKELLCLSCLGVSPRRPVFRASGLPLETAPDQAARKQSAPSCLCREPELPPNKAYRALAARPEAHETRGSSNGPTIGSPRSTSFLPCFRPIPSRPGPANDRDSGSAPPSSLLLGQWPRCSPRPPAPPSSSGRVLHGRLQVNLLPILVSSW